ncbi:hypothetical protein ACFQH6_03710 [Halobacteriaceae archaeon GCM10025711]
MSSGLENRQRAEILDSVTVEATGIGGGRVRLVAYYTGGDGEEMLHADNYPTNFYEDRTARGSFKNEVKAALDGYELDPSKWVEAWQKWTSSLVAAKDDERPNLVPENVRQLADGTEHVHVLTGGDSAVWRVEISWRGKTREIELTHEDMASDGTKPLKNQLFKAFLNSPEIQQEDWIALRNYWTEIQEEKARETMTEKDRKLESFIETVTSRVTPHESADVLANGREAAWVDWENDHGLNGVGSEVAVAWVQSSLVSDILDSMDNAPKVGELGTELQNRGFTVRGSANLQPAGKDTKGRYWFFDPAALGITEMDTFDDAAEGATSEVDA